MEKAKKDKCHVIAVLNAAQREQLNQLQFYWIAKRQERVTVKQAIVYSLEIAHKVLCPSRKPKKDKKN